MMKLKNILDKFKGKRILVLGDVMSDKFISGDVSRISPEAPVPIVHVTSQSVVPGGAANTANNLKSLGAEVFLAGVIGSDSSGRELLNELKFRGIDTDGIIVDKKRPTTVKTRVISLNQQIIRIDRESRDEIDESVSNKLLNYIHGVANKDHGIMNKETSPDLDGNFDGIIISDYGKGVITHEILEGISGIDEGTTNIRSADGIKDTKTGSSNKKERVPIVVDPCRENFLSYGNITAFICNQNDATKALGISIINETSLKNIGYKLVSSLGCTGVVITRGKDGMCVFDKDGNLSHIHGIPRDIFDVTGVSDTVTAVFTLALTSGADFVDAAKLANYAGFVVTGKVGTATTSINEIRDVLNE